MYHHYTLAPDPATILTLLFRFRLVHLLFAVWFVRLTFVCFFSTFAALASARAPASISHVRLRLRVLRIPHRSAVRALHPRPAPRRRPKPLSRNPDLSPYASAPLQPSIQFFPSRHCDLQVDPPATKPRSATLVQAGIQREDS
ncbi:hypothetical protein B0H14DRAFT_3876535 [Mycena olivaceomarginata]|nr:hypothetical protein B0H14DRAFT_3876535 [Mycena olivaceomarginata]